MKKAFCSLHCHWGIQEQLQLYDPETTSHTSQGRMYASNRHRNRSGPVFQMLHHLRLIQAQSKAFYSHPHPYLCQILGKLGDFSLMIKLKGEVDLSVVTLERLNLSVTDDRPGQKTSLPPLVLVH
ncbi:xin actin-binding repeat-containing protein 2 [Platysternon megacephalum]|uniref:Xin actin-binding repeat-containing protein 2 n=1 Tax=Platysternon megacephalum TaxID=55544 RepID=A0A4D9F5F6_9SAUR|nr:xin actin-binding repeat-containing protein 2 [Platysternon megacephalum]